MEYLFQICEICHWNFNRNCVESVSCFGQYGHFNVNFSIHEHSICFHLFASSSIYFFNVLQFSEQRSFTPMVKFIPRYLIFVIIFVIVAAVNGIVFLVLLSDYIKMKSFRTAKETVNEMKKDPTVWKSIFANSISYKQMISKIYKEFI